MRFGLPQRYSEVELPSNQAQLPVLPSAAANFRPKPPLSALSETLQKLDKLCLERISEQDKEIQGKYASTKEKAMARTAVGALNVVFELQLAKLQKSVEAAISKHEKALREAEEQRRREEEQRRKEEEQRKKQEELKRAKEEQERKLKLEKEQKEREAREKAEKLEKEKQALQNAKTNKGLTVASVVDKEVLEYMLRIPKIKKDVVEELAKNPALKKNVGALKRKINVKFGQLSNSMTQLRTVTAQVVDLILSCKLEPLAYQWILNFVSKSIVSQAETEVTVKPDAALPLARLAVALLHQVEGLEYYLSARMVKKCSLILGFTCALESDGDRILMGWKHSENSWETEVKYEERIGGILTLWAVMASLDQSGQYEFFSMGAQWRFLARVLNTKPELISDVHFVMLCNWWEAAAKPFLGVYKSQAQKLLLVAATKFAAIGSKKSFAAATRLQILGEDLFQKNNFNSLKEMEA